MGRITGSASIETLVRVGIEKENGLSPEAKMVVLHDFTPCVDDELEVKRGQTVHVLYQENDWVYVISDENAEGFIPHSYCAQFGSQLAELALNVKKKMPRNDGIDGKAPTAAGGPLLPPNQPGFPDVLPPKQNESRSNSIMSNETSSSQPEVVHPFYKEVSGKYIVLYNYMAQDENDLTVERGQCVTVLNTDDGDWFWVSRFDGQEGFVPSGFIYPLDAIQRQRKDEKHFFSQNLLYIHVFSEGLSRPTMPYTQKMVESTPTFAMPYHQTTTKDFTSNAAISRPATHASMPWSSAGSSGQFFFREIVAFMFMEQEKIEERIRNSKRGYRHLFFLLN